MLYPSSPGLLVLRALQVGSDVDCFLFFGLTHPEKAGADQPAVGKKPSLTLNQPTWLARQAPRMALEIRRLMRPSPSRYSWTTMVL